MAVSADPKQKKMLSEDDITEVTLQQMKDNKEGVTNYPILDFDERAMGLLCSGVEETLRESKITPAGGPVYKFLKRLFDIVVSALALLVFAIPLGILMLIIYIDDKGSPIFSQVRLTERGKPFRMYKLRSMCMDAEARFAEVMKENESDGLAFKAEDDPRVTKIGKFIRKTSLDELPQFWNVLKGDMSIIGPRPPLPREVVLYTPEHMDRLLVKGGLACICQTEGRSDMPFEEWVGSDIEYIQKRSLWFDLVLIFKMIIAVILRKGAK